MKRGFPSVVLIVTISGLAVGSLLTSCKKNEDVKPASSGGGDGDTTAVLSATDEDSLKYLMYQIMQVSVVNGGRNTSYDLPTYYWYDQVPKLDPAGAQYAKAEDLLSAMMSYPKWEGKTVDRYSFLDRTGSVANQIQNGIVDGVFSGLGSKGDFGLEITYAVNGSTNQTNLWVMYADKNSPAGLAGIKRGWEITAVNGNDVSYDGPDGANVNRVKNAVYNSDEVTLTFLKPDNTSVTKTLDAAQYQVNPILFDSVYTINNKKVGYFVFYTFSSVEDDQGAGTATKSALDKEFDKLKAAGINDLIVDLRYNGGGAVSTAAYLDSAIAPASTKGKVMYKYLYNDKLSSNEGLLGLSPVVYFPGGGGLTLDHVFFIVSRNTASASELTLNNLKPYMDVQLVGDTTYGKPVGFIDFTISDYTATGKKQYLADLYAIDFATENANGVGEYYNGIPPDEEATDYVNIPWGDPADDDNLNKIFNYIGTGRFARTGERLAGRGDYRISVPENIRPHHFNGMIDYRLSRKLESALKK